MHGQHLGGVAAHVGPGLGNGGEHNLVQNLAAPVHISKLADHRIEKVEDACKIGDMMWVKVTDMDEKGRVNLSHKDAVREISREQTSAKASSKEQILFFIIPPSFYRSIEVCPICCFCEGNLNTPEKASVFLGMTW